MLSPLAASNFDSPAAAQTEEVQMDQPAASTRKPPTKATKAQTEADVDPGEIE
eukprot:s2612_g1.t1